MHNKKICAVVESWCQRLPSQMATLQDLHRDVAGGAPDALAKALSFRLEAHRLQGSAYVLGFAKIGALLKTLEALLDDLCAAEEHDRDRLMSQVGEAMDAVTSAARDVSPECSELMNPLSAAS